MRLLRRVSDVVGHAECRSVCGAERIVGALKLPHFAADPAWVLKLG